MHRYRKASVALLAGISLTTLSSLPMKYETQASAVPATSPWTIYTVAEQGQNEVRLLRQVLPQQPSYEKRTPNWIVKLTPEPGRVERYTETITYLGKYRIYNVEMDFGGETLSTEFLWPNGVTTLRSVTTKGIKSQTMGLKWETMGQRAQLTPHHQTIMIVFNATKSHR